MPTTYDGEPNNLSVRFVKIGKIEITVDCVLM